MPPVCVRCRVPLRCAKNDYIVEEMADTTFPYRVWLADLYACPACGAEVVTGFAKEAWGEQWQANYGAKALQADLRFWPRADMVPAAGSIAPNALEACRAVVDADEGGMLAAEAHRAVAMCRAALNATVAPRACNNALCGLIGAHTPACKAADAQFAREQR